jgi:DNA-binding CsgD family transcriptional regulator
MLGVPLTTRQIHIVELIAEGMSNKEIADAILTTEDTVKTHIRRAFRKMNAKDRAHLVALAFRVGVLKLDGHDGPDHAHVLWYVHRYVVTGEGQRLRERAGVGCHEVARLCGVSVGDVRAWEGGRMPSPAHVPRYAGVLRHLAESGTIPRSSV